MFCTPDEHSCLKAVAKCECMLCFKAPTQLLFYFHSSFMHDLLNLQLCFLHAVLDLSVMHSCVQIVKYFMSHATLLKMKNKVLFKVVIQIIS